MSAYQLETVVGLVVLIGAVPATALIIAAGVWFETKAQNRNRERTDRY